MFDYSKVMNSLKGLKQSEEKEKTYKYKVVYPSEGSLNVRILFNPKSGLITRLVNRHNIGGAKVPCLATYTSRSDCPICKVLEQAENAGIKVPYSSKSKVRAVMYAQYHSSTYEIEGVNKGDIIFLMVPWSVYKDIQKFINDVSSTNESMNAAFNSPEYFAFTIERGATNQDWSGRINPVITVSSGCKSNEEFETMLSEIDSLYDSVNHIHEHPTEDDMKYINEAAEQLRNNLFEVEAETPQAPVNPNQEPEAITADTLSSGDGAVSASGDQKTYFGAPECFGVNFVPETDTNPVKSVQRIKCKVCDYHDSCMKTLADSRLPF